MNAEQIRQLLLTALGLLEDYWYVPAIIISLHLIYVLLMDILGKSKPPLPSLRKLKKRLAGAGFSVEQVPGQSASWVLTAGTEAALVLVVVFKATVTGEDIQESMVLQQTHNCQRTVILGRAFTANAWEEATDAGVLLWPAERWQQRVSDLAEELAANQET